MVKEKLLSLHRDTLVRNSFYLMLSTGIMAALGFVFWFICARLFSAAQIGLATTLISAMTLISYVSLLGFNSTFIRVLPTSDRRSDEINTGLLLSILTAVIIAAGYAQLAPIIAPKLALVHKNFLYELGFIALVAFASINLLTDSIFIAYRAAKYNLLIDGVIMSSVKLSLPFAFIGLGAYGVFAAAGAAAAVAMALSITFLITKFDYTPRVRMKLSVLKGVMHYSFANYLANLLNIAPTLVLPIVVLDNLGPSSAGHYYLAFMVANILYTVVYSVSQSLFAEGSYADQKLPKLIRKSVAVTSAIIVPGTIALYFSANFLLEVFGKSYGVEATEILRALALAAPTVAIYILACVLLRISKKVYSLVVVNAVYFLTISSLAVVWAARGLAWVGYAWLAGNIVAGAVGLIFLGWRGWRFEQDYESNYV